MEKKYEHIEKMEKIMAQQEELVRKLEMLLKEVDARKRDYEELNSYYYSDRRVRDLEDEENRLIPEDMPRGVLSEDEIYNLFLDYHETAVHMMETALGILKISG